MKFKPLLLAAATTLLSSQMSAGEVVFYITEDGAGVRDLAVTVNGQRKLVNNTGFVSFDVPAGDHQVEFSKFGEWLGDFQFRTANATQQADIQVELVGGEPLADVFVYEANSAEAQAIGVLAGYLQSEETGGVVSGARVAVSDELAVMTDDNGYFSLSLPRGEYQLTVAHPNYGRRELSGVRVMANAETNLSMSLSLSGSGTIEEIVAVGSYVANTATAQQRDSSAVLNAIGSEQLARFGDSSAASALKRVSGVSVVGGQFAVVRGLQGRYISSTLNGSLMPSTDPMRRDVPLDLFPSSVLGGINIQKSYTPDLPGDTTGGAIMMETKGLPDDAIRKLSLSGGFNGRTTWSDINGYEGGKNDWLGMDDGTRELPSSVNAATNGGIESINVFTDCTTIPNCYSPAEAASLANDFSTIYQVDQIQAKPERGISYGQGNLYDIESGQLGYYAAFQYKDAWEARHKGKLDDQAVAGTFERTKRKVDLTGYLVAGFENNDHSVTSKTILLRKTENTIRTTDVYDSAEDRRNEKAILEWIERQYLGQQFSGSHFFDGGNHQIDWRVDLGQTKRDEPDRRTYLRERGNLTIPTVERRFSELTEDSLVLGLDYTFVYPVSDMNTLTFKTGVMSSAKERTVTMGRYGFNVNASAGVTVDPKQSIEDILAPDNFNADALRLQTRTAQTDSYNANDDITAVYASTEFESDRWSVLLGARVEDSEQVLEYPEKSSATSVLESNDVLPALALNWRMTEDTQLRFALSQTLSRPGLTERSESTQYDPETDRELIGNANLVISSITNMDLRAEHYFSDDESISFAVFYKDIENPIERGIPDASGSSSDGFTFRNEESATLYGFEIDFRKNVINSNTYSGFLAGNLSYVDATVNLSVDSARQEQIESRNLQGQSEYLVNMQFGIDHLATGQSITLLANYFDDRIYAAGRGISPEVEDARLVFDLVYQYDLGEQLSVNAKINNLTDAQVSYSRDGKKTESYYDGTGFSASIDWLF